MYKRQDKYITEDEFKEEYNRVKKQISELQKRKEELEKNNSNIDINRIREIITEFQSGKDMTNEFLKEIIYHIEIYSNDRIDIIFNL